MPRLNRRTDSVGGAVVAASLTDHLDLLIEQDRLGLPPGDASLVAAVDVVDDHRRRVQLPSVHHAVYGLQQLSSLINISGYWSSSTSR